MKKLIFDFDNYKNFCHYWVQNHPEGARGKWSKIAKYLHLSTVSVSHIFKGTRDLSLEQAHEMTDLFGFTELEAEYFFLLVQYERAGTHKLKLKFRKELAVLRTKSQNIKSRVKVEKELTENSKAIFYSNWFYSAVRLASSIEENNSIERISSYLDLPVNTVREVAEFLIANGLCVQTGKGLQMGPTSTHLESSSMLISRHHTNWRVKSLERMSSLLPEELHYTGPMALSEETMVEVRRLLVDVIDSVVKKVIPSRSETLACLNIDWFKLKKNPRV